MALDFQSSKDSQDKLFLDIILHQAINSRSDVHAQDEIIEQSKQQEWVLLSELLPQVNVDGTIQKSYLNSYAEELLHTNFNQTLFDPSGALLQREVQRLTTKIKQYNKLELQNRVRLDLTRDFFQHRNRLYEKPFQDALEKSSLTEYKSALLKKSIGLYSAPQIQAAETQFQSAKSQVFKLGNVRKISKQQLITSSENPLDLPLVIPETTLILNTLWKNLQQTDEETLVQQAIKFRPIFKELNAQIEQAEIKTDIARYYYLPSIAFDANIYKYRFAPTALTATQTTAEAALLYPWTVGLTASWSFDSFGSLHSVRAARAERLEKVLTKKRTEFTIKNDVITAHLELQNAAEELHSSLKSVEQAHIDFLKNVKSFEVGLISKVEFEQAQTTWEQAQIKLENTLTTTVNKHEELMFNAGYPPGPSELQNLSIPPAPEFNTSEITLKTEPGKAI